MIKKIASVTGMIFGGSDILSIIVLPISFIVTGNSLPMWMANFIFGVMGLSFVGLFLSAMVYSW